MVREIRFPSVARLAGPPVIRKNGIISPSGGEMSVFVHRGALMRLQNVDDGFVVTPYAVNDFRRVFGRRGPYYYQAYCEGDRVYVYAAEGSVLYSWISDDLTHWTESVALRFPENFRLFNSSVCRDGGGWMMAVECRAADDPRERGRYLDNPYTGKPFTIFFARSRDLAHWEPLSFELGYSTARYTACPCLKYSGGRYYMICLEELPAQRYAPYIYRTTDFRTWEIGFYNPLFTASREDLTPKPGVVLTDAEREMNFTHLNTNNSDVDLCEYEGKTVIVYCSGNQGVTWGGMYCEAVYDGPLDEFLRANFE